MRSIILGIVLCASMSSYSIADKKWVKIDITAPANDETLHKDIAKVIGTVSDPTTRVWIVIKPDRVSECYLQPQAAVGSDGKWQVSARFGEQNTHNEGFDFMAIALRKDQQPLVSKGNGKITCWPDGAAKSKVIHVHRE